MLKKIAALLLALCMLICLSACNKGDTSSDISSDVSQTQITDSQTEESSEANTTTDTSTQTSENTDKNENSSTPQSSTSKPTSTTNSNTSSTSKPTESSKPTTSSTPSSTPSTPSHTHSWGNWKTETKALIGKEGTEKRTCSSCKETEKRSTKNNAAYNSFFDFYLHEYFAWFGNTVYETTFNIDALFHCGDLIARDDYWDGDAEDIANATIPVDVYYKALKEHFVLTDDIISQMKSQRNADAYPVTMDGFTPQPYDTVVGYTHNGGNKYTVYWNSSYNEDVKPVKVELEYNLLNDKPNRYISIEFIDAIPANIVK